MGLLQFSCFLRFHHISLHLRRLFRRTLQHRFAVKLQKCFVGYETSPNFPSAWGRVETDWLFYFCVNLSFNTLTWVEGSEVHMRATFDELSVGITKLRFHATTFNGHSAVRLWLGGFDFLVWRQQQSHNWAQAHAPIGKSFPRHVSKGQRRNTRWGCGLPGHLSLRLPRGTQTHTQLIYIAWEKERQCT